MKTPISTAWLTNVLGSVSNGLSGSDLGGGTGLVGAAGRAIRTGGSGGRRDGESTGRARVSDNALRGFAHSGLPTAGFSFVPTTGFRRSVVCSGPKAVSEQTAVAGH